MALHRLSKSIATRLILCGIAIVFAGSLVRYAILSRIMQEDIHSLVVSQQRSMTDYMAKEIGQKLARRQTALKDLASAIPRELLSQPAALQQWLATQSTHLGFPGGLQYLDAAAVGHAADPYLSGVLSGKSPMATARPVDRAAVSLSFAVPVTQADGVIAGLLVGYVSPSTPGFLDLIPGSRVGSAGGVQLVSPLDGVIIASSETVRQLPPLSPAVLAVSAASDKQSKASDTADAVRNEVVTGSAVPGTPWLLIARQSGEEAFAPLLRIQHFILRYSGVAAMAVLLPFALFVFLTFRPLIHAARHAERMTSGEIPLEPLPVRHGDEIGHLTKAFNRLLSKVTESQAELDRMAHHDQLTGLPNRVLLADRLQQALERAHRSGSRLAILCLDLDGFKQINDTLGHDAGDIALRQVAERLAETVRLTDTLARVGGDEFVILLPDLGPEDRGQTAKTIVDRCLKAMEAPFSVRGKHYQLGVSIGVAEGGEGSRADILMSAADRAMYRAKSAGGRRAETTDNLT